MKPVRTVELDGRILIVSSVSFSDDGSTVVFARPLVGYRYNEKTGRAFHVRLGAERVRLESPALRSAPRTRATLAPILRAEQLRADGKREAWLATEEGREYRRMLDELRAIVRAFR